MGVAVPKSFLTMLKEVTMHEDSGYGCSRSILSTKGVRISLKKPAVELDVSLHKTHRPAGWYPGTSRWFSNRSDSTLPQLEIPDIAISHRPSINDNSISVRNNDFDCESTNLLQIHAAFKQSLTPGSGLDTDLKERGRLDLISIKLMFPDIRRDDIYIVFAAWLAFACAMDDHLETLPTMVGVASLQNAVKVLQLWDTPDEGKPSVSLQTSEENAQSITRPQRGFYLVKLAQMMWELFAWSTH